VGGAVVVVVGSWIGGSLVVGAGGAEVVVVGSWIGGSLVVGAGGAEVVVTTVVVVGRVVGTAVVGATVVGASVVGGSVVGTVDGGGVPCWGWAAAAVPTTDPVAAINTRAHRERRLRRGMPAP
jgi:hypothetical protein